MALPSRCAFSVRYGTPRRFLQMQKQISDGVFIRGHFRSASTAAQRLPRIVSPSLWQSIVPRSLRHREKKATMELKPTNPASYFIWIYLFIGSQAIRIIGMQNEYREYMRKADLKLAKLREVITALQNGKEIDVEKVLGTGDEKAEKEWEDAMEEIMNEDRKWSESKKKNEEERVKFLAEQQEASPINAAQTQQATPHSNQSARPVPGFY